MHEGPLVVQRAFAARAHGYVAKREMNRDAAHCDPQRAAWRDLRGARRLKLEARSRTAAVGTLGAETQSERMRDSATIGDSRSENQGGGPMRAYDHMNRVKQPH